MRLGYASFFGLQDVSMSGPGFTVRALRADPDKIVGQHSHEGAHVVAILRRKYLSLASPGAKLGAATVVYNPHGVEHADTFDGADGRFVTVSYELDRYPASPGEPPQPLALEGASALVAVLRILDNLRRPWANAPGDLEAPVVSLAASGYAGAETLHSSAPRWAIRARERLTARGRPLSIADLASEEGLHPVAFARGFRRWFGKSPFALAMETRLTRAAGDLARRRDAIADVAARHGFFDQAHFAHHFKRAFGAPPGAFRRAFQS
jgi:AraC family transcriptional regulator